MDSAGFTFYHVVITVRQTLNGQAGIPDCLFIKSHRLSPIDIRIFLSKYRQNGAIDFLENFLKMRDVYHQSGLLIELMVLADKLFLVSHPAFLCILLSAH